MTFFMCDSERNVFFSSSPACLSPEACVAEYLADNGLDRLSEEDESDIYVYHEKQAWWFKDGALVPVNG